MEQLAVKTSNELAAERTKMAAARTALAASRSLMAWIRTALSMIGFGFTIYKFLQDVEGIRPGAARNAGLFLIALGVVSVVFGCADYWQVTGGLRPFQQPVRKLPLVLASLVALLGIVLFVGTLMHMV